MERRSARRRSPGPKPGTGTAAKRQRKDNPVSMCMRLVLVHDAAHPAIMPIACVQPSSACMTAAPLERVPYSLAPCPALDGSLWEHHNLRWLQGTMGGTGASQVTDAASGSGSATRRPRSRTLRQRAPAPPAEQPAACSESLPPTAGPAAHCGGDPATSPATVAALKAQILSILGSRARVSSC